MPNYVRTALPFKIDVEALGAVVQISEQQKDEYNQRQAELRAKRLAYFKQYYLLCPDKCYEATRRWMREHREQYLEIRRRYYYAHREELLAVKRKEWRKYYDTHREEIRERSRQWRAKHAPTDKDRAQKRIRWARYVARKLEQDPDFYHTQYVRQSENQRIYRETHREEIRAKNRAYAQRPEVKARKMELQRQRRARKKAEKEQQQRATKDNV